MIEVEKEVLDQVSRDELRSGEYSEVISKFWQLSHERRMASIRDEIQRDPQGEPPALSRESQD